MSSIPGGIWFMWFLNFGLAIASLVIARIINKKEGGETKWL
jgi:hypothetical protein